jgi:hypothetical protein
MPNDPPSPANPARHVVDVDDDQRTHVVFLVARDPDALSTVGADVGTVDSHDGIARGAADEAGGFRVGFVGVIDEAMGWIRVGEKLPLTEEVLLEVIVLEKIFGPTARGAEGQSRDGGEEHDDDDNDDGKQ